MNYLFECNQLVKSYGKDFKALDGINLKIEKNKIYGLIGRNGAGKTTLLGIASGQNPSTSGTVTYEGGQVWENENVMNQICFSREINPITTFGPDGRKVKQLLKVASIFYDHWDEDFAKKLIEEFEIDVKKRLNKLSKGMLSAVSIIIALASRAEVTFLDEPVAGLDISMRERFYRILLDDFMENPRTYIISTHIIDEAAGIFEDVIIIEKGKIILKENTDDFLSGYRMVSGKEEVVREACKGLEIIYTQALGKSLTVCAKTKGKPLENEFDVDVAAVSLQKLFLYITEHEREEEKGGKLK